MAGDGRGARPLRLRRRGPHPRAGRGVAGTARLRLHARRRRGGAGLRARARRRVGRRLRRDAARAARRRHHLCAGRRARAARALRACSKGGRVVCGGIHMSDIPSFPYRILWEERQIVSVANLTRADAHRIPCARAARSACDRGHASIRSPRRTRRSTICAPAACKARRCWRPRESRPASSPITDASRPVFCSARTCSTLRRRSLWARARGERDTMSMTRSLCGRHACRLHGPVARRLAWRNRPSPSRRQERLTAAMC